MFLVFNVVFAQYVIARPLVGRGNLRQGRPPFVASRHFPRFIGDIYPAIKVGAASYPSVLQSSGLLHFVRNDIDDRKGYPFLVLRREIPLIDIIVFLAFPTDGKVSA